MLRSCAILALTMLVGSATAAPTQDEVFNLPGLSPPPTFKQYAGYLDANAGKHFFYWFTEAKDVIPATAPVVLWLNGGPGCSSVNGMLTENGPFYVNTDGRTVGYNPYAWNSQANVIFMESPAGVGFSYSDDGNVLTDDEQVAQDNYAAVNSFFQKFPEYSANPFFIVGESYAGIYVPTLSYLIVNGSNNYNFQAFAVGNGLHEYKSNYNTEILFYAAYGLIDLRVTNNLLTYCCSGSPQRCNFYETQSTPCIEALLSAHANFHASGVNPYNVLGYCQRGPPTNGFYHPMAPKFRPLAKAFTDEQRKNLGNLGMDPPCYNSENIRQWINQQSVRDALNVPASVQLWDSCSDPVNAEYQSTIETVAPHYQYLLNHVRGLIYNGDTDSMCNFLGGEYFAENLGRQELQAYRPWFFQNQTAGFQKNYDNLTYLTILGSGHMVPTDRPGQALYMFNNFIKNLPF